MSGKEKTYSQIEIEIADYIYFNPAKKTAEIIAVFCGKLRKSKRTIEGYINRARIYNQTRLRGDEEVKDKIRHKEIEKTVKAQIPGKIRLLELAGKVAEGGARKIEENCIIYSGSEQMNSIKWLWDKQGFDADSQNEVLKEIDYKRLTAEELQIYFSLTEKAKC